MPISAAFSIWPGFRRARRRGRRRPSSRPRRLRPGSRLGAADRGVLLVQDADRRGGEQEIEHTLFAGAGTEAVVVVQHRRDDAGRAVGRRGDHAPPAAFSSFTASAYRFTQSSTVNGSRIAASGRDDSSANSAGARRTTCNPPGSVPLSRMPRATQSCIARHSSRSPARISSSLRQAFSFANISCAMARPLRSHCASSSAPVWNGNASSVVSATMRSSATSSWLTTKPPPTE